MLKATLEKSGTRLDDFDLIIAACAMAHNLTLVTNNIVHFKRIERLKLTNWLDIFLELLQRFDLAKRLLPLCPFPVEE
jgi:hypothetical protein